MEGCATWPQDLYEEYIKKGYWQNVPLGDAFDKAAEAFSDKVALVFNDKQITYGQLKSISDKLARRLLESGLKPLDRVVVQLPNTLDFVYSYLALLKIGVIPVMCLPQHRFAEIAYIAEKAEAKGYFIPEVHGKFNYLELAEEVRTAVPSLKNIYVAGENCPKDYISLNNLINEGQFEGEINFRPDPMEVAVLLLSGGTTGLPKIIPRTHNDYLYQVKITCLPEVIGEQTVYLATAPLAHNMTLACPGVTGILLKGGKVVLTSSTDSESICRLIDKEKITYVPLVPAMIIGLLNFEKRKDYDISSLQVIVSGGSKLNPAVAQRVNPELGCTLIQQFGMGEGLLTQTGINETDEVRFNTIGRPVSPSDEIKIIDDLGQEVPPGEVGELICRGPYTIRGYYQAPEHNEKVFTKDGFYMTGDVARLDPKSGCLIIEGRKKDLINRGGEKINAEEVENLILTYPSVDNAALIAMSDPLLGERGCAYVTLKKGCLTLDELNSFLLEKKIAKFKLPERLEVVEKFPLTSVGKISKKDLRDDIEQKIMLENNCPEMKHLDSGGQCSCN